MILREWAKDRFGEDVYTKTLYALLRSAINEDAVTANMRAAQSSTGKRLLTLLSEGKYLEYVNMASPLIEYGIKRLIGTYIFCINSAIILGDFESKIQISAHINEKPLGELIKELKRYCNDQDLISKLDCFNGNRKKASHKIYELSRDIDEVNSSLKNYVETDPAKEILRQLASTHKQMAESFKEKLIMDFSVTQEDWDKAANELN